MRIARILTTKVRTQDSLTRKTRLQAWRYSRVESPTYRTNPGNSRTYRQSAKKITVTRKTVSCGATCFFAENSTELLESHLAPLVLRELLPEIRSLESRCNFENADKCNLFDQPAHLTELRDVSFPPFECITHCRTKTHPQSADSDGPSSMHGN